MDERGLGVEQLTAARVDEFLVERRATRSALYSRRAMRTPLDFLAGLGVLPVEEPVTPTPNELVLEAFEQYLLVERGLLPRTAAAQVARVRRFLACSCPPGGVGELSPAEVTQALLDEGADHAVSSVKRMGYTPKAFLRFAFLTGLIDRDLTGAMVPVRSHQPSLLPIGIDRVQTVSLLAACDCDTAVGRRDYAVILLLARLGLRATEVARLRLEDIDWHHGEITVHGKGRRPVHRCRDRRVAVPAGPVSATPCYAGSPGAPAKACSGSSSSSHCASIHRRAGSGRRVALGRRSRAQGHRPDLRLMSS